MFRRTRSGAEDGPGQDAANGSGAVPAADATDARPHAVTASKGRPTPKRSEAERRRRQPYTAPKDRKEAARATRGRSREDRSRRVQAMRRGEEWALLPRDRGAGRALTRNYVDSRRRASEYYMYAVVLLLILSTAGSVLGRGVATIVDTAFVVMIFVIIGESLFLGRRARALVSERLPGESTRGLGYYAGMRAVMPRRLRSPKPKVKPGDTI